MGLLEGTLPAVSADVVKKMSETLFEGYFRNPDKSKFMNIVENVKSDKQLIVFKRYSGLSGFAKADCDRTANDKVSIGISDKTWQPKYIGDLFEECFAPFDESFTAWMLKDGNDKPDLEGTEIGMFIVEQLADLVEEVLLRHFFFGDKAIVAGTNNSIATGSAKYFNVIDGIWAQVFDIVAAAPARLTVSTTIQTRNAAASYSLQAFTSTDTTNRVVSKALDEGWYGADRRLRQLGKSELVWLATQSMSDQYERERKDANAIAESWLRVENGMGSLVSNGIEVLPMANWDQTILDYFGDDQTPVKSILPHRALLVPRKNLMLGTESAGTLSTLRVWYSQDDAMMRAEYGMKIDAKVGLDNLVQVIY